MFTYADLSKTGHDHFLFNTGYFTVLKSIFPDDEVKHYSHQSHFNYIKEEIDLQALTYHPVYILKKKKNKFLFQWIYKNLYDFLILFVILRRSAANNGKFVFFAMMPVRSMWYLLFLHRLFFRKQQTILTFHGEIETWFAPNKNLTQKFHAYIFRRLFSYKNERFKFFVPNAFIRDNLQKEPLFQNKDILTVYHLLQPQLTPKSMFDMSVIFAHIGSTEKRKNSDCFFELARLLRYKNPELNDIEFKVAGKYNPVFDRLLDESSVVLSDQQRILERDYFDAEIASAHFSVIFIYPDEYLYRESGTVLEAVKFHKPIIGLKHAYMDFLESKYWQIGIYGNTLEELVQQIEALLANRQKAEEQYRQMVANIQFMHSQITLPALRNELKQQMKQTGIIA